MEHLNKPKANPAHHAIDEHLMARDLGVIQFIIGLIELGIDCGHSWGRLRAKLFFRPDLQEVIKIEGCKVPGHLGVGPNAHQNFSDTGDIEDGVSSILLFHSPLIIVIHLCRRRSLDKMGSVCPKGNMVVYSVLRIGIAINTGKVVAPHLG